MDWFLKLFQPVVSGSGFTEQLKLSAGQYRKLISTGAKCYIVLMTNDRKGRGILKVLVQLENKDLIWVDYDDILE